MPVSIHAPAWGATRSLRLTACAPRVSIHAPAWGATTDSVAHWSYGVGFQSTRPRGARLIEVHDAEAYTVFQSTRPRGARPIHIMCYGTIFSVSIHAPAWGATVLQSYVERYFHVSIHAPAWGATGSRQLLSRLHKFQSTRPRGARRHASHVTFTVLITVSIHAPAWGATRPRIGRCEC